MLTFLERNINAKTWNVQIAANAAVRYNINTKLPNYINNIIGIATSDSGVSPNNTALVTVGETIFYFITIKTFDGFFLENIRYDLLLYSNGNVIYQNRFFACNIRGKDIDLFSSYITNPQPLSNALMITFYYI